MAKKKTNLCDDKGVCVPLMGAGVIFGILLTTGVWMLDSYFSEKEAARESRCSAIRAQFNDLHFYVPADKKGDIEAIYRLRNYAVGQLKAQAAENDCEIYRF